MQDSDHFVSASKHYPLKNVSFESTIEPRYIKIRVGYTEDVELKIYRAMGCLSKYLENKTRDLTALDCTMIKVGNN